MILVSPGHREQWAYGVEYRDTKVLCRPGSVGQSNSADIGGSPSWHLALCCTECRKLRVGGVECKLDKRDHFEFLMFLIIQQRS